MDSACVYELTQGLKMAELLRVNLHSPETRDYLIQKILSSYENALFVLKSDVSAGQPTAPALPEPSLPESWMFTGSRGSEKFQFDQSFSGQQGLNANSKKRKGSPIWEDQVNKCGDKGLEDDTDDCYNRRKYGKNDNFAQSALPPPPPSPEKHDITPTHQYHQLSPPSAGKMLSNLKASLSVNTSDFGGDRGTAPSSFTFPSTSCGLMEDYHELHFPNYYDDVSPSFISPVTSESNIFSEWGSSQSLDFLADVDSSFEFNSLF